MGRGTDSVGGADFRTGFGLYGAEGTADLTAAGLGAVLAATGGVEVVATGGVEEDASAVEPSVDSAASVSSGIQEGLSFSGKASSSIMECVIDSLAASFSASVGPVFTTSAGCSSRSLSRNEALSVEVDACASVDNPKGSPST